MTKLTVLYDPSCSLCCRARRWMQKQSQFVPLEFVGASTPRAKDMFPEIDSGETLQDLTVVADDGALYRGAKAWLICLWALRKYRGWSLTLGSDALLPSARRFIDWVSRNRKKLALS